MTETTTVTITVEVPLVEFDDKVDIGENMLLCALGYWEEQYNDEYDFEVDSIDGGYRVFDPAAMTEPMDISYDQFFDEHFKLIWLGTITNYRHDWIGFAFRSNDADYDDYDALTCEAVLQNLLYGEIVYG